VTEQTADDVGTPEVEEHYETVSVRVPDRVVRAYQDIARGAGTDIDTVASVLFAATMVSVRPKDRERLPGVDARRTEDMSTTGWMRLVAHEDGDMGVVVTDADGRTADVEFCASGGHSPRTLQALRDLSRAMAEDAADPACLQPEDR
jgi:hypothetical protein